MAIDVTEIQGIDTISASRIIINENFSILKNAINNFSDYVNITDKTISNVQKISVIKGTTPITETLIETNGSITVGGNITATGGVTASNLTISGNTNVTGGDITISSALSNLIHKGNFKLDGELVLTDFNSQSVDASNELFFSNSQSTSNLVYDGNTAIAGKVDLTKRSVVVLDWSDFVATNDSQYYLHRILLKVLNTTVIGQRVLLIARINEDLALPHYSSDPAGYWILRDTLSYSSGSPSSLSVGIKFSGNNQSCEVIFDGTNWLPLNLYNGAQAV